MNDEIREILEKPNVYSFNDECYLYFGDYNKLKDYITNLQEEKEDLENRLENAVADCNLRLQENERLKNDVEDISCSHFSLFKSYEDYKSRIEKAVEYIDRETGKGIYESGYGRGTAITICKEHLLNILQNGSDDNAKN